MAVGNQDRAWPAVTVRGTVTACCVAPAEKFRLSGRHRGPHVGWWRGERAVLSVLLAAWPAIYHQPESGVGRPSACDHRRKAWRMGGPGHAWMMVWPAVTVP